MIGRNNKPVRMKNVDENLALLASPVATSYEYAAVLGAESSQNDWDKSVYIDQRAEYYDQDYSLASEISDSVMQVYSDLGPEAAMQYLTTAVVHPFKYMQQDLIRNIATEKKDPKEEIFSAENISEALTGVSRLNIQIAVAIDNIKQQTPVEVHPLVDFIRSKVSLPKQVFNVATQFEYDFEKDEMYLGERTGITDMQLMNLEVMARSVYLHDKMWQEENKKENSALVDRHKKTEEVLIDARTADLLREAHFSFTFGDNRIEPNTERWNRLSDAVFQMLNATGIDEIHLISQILNLGVLPTSPHEKLLEALISKMYMVGKPLKLEILSEILKRNAIADTQKQDLVKTNKARLNRDSTISVHPYCQAEVEEELGFELGERTEFMEIDTYNEQLRSLQRRLKRRISNKDISRRIKLKQFSHANASIELQMEFEREFINRTNELLAIARKVDTVMKEQLGYRLQIKDPELFAQQANRNLVGSGLSIVEIQVSNIRIPNEELLDPVRHRTFQELIRNKPNVIGVAVGAYNELHLAHMLAPLKSICTRADMAYLVTSSAHKHAKMKAEGRGILSMKERKQRLQEIVRHFGVGSPKMVFSEQDLYPGFDEYEIITDWAHLHTESIPRVQTKLEKQRSMLKADKNKKFVYVRGPDNIPAPNRPATEPPYDSAFVLPHKTLFEADLPFVAKRYDQLGKKAVIVIEDPLIPRSTKLAQKKGLRIEERYGLRRFFDSDVKEV